MMACDSSPRCSLIRARLPIPKPSSCQMSWKLTSSRPVHWLRLLLGPRPKIPAWRYIAGGLEAVEHDDGEERPPLLPADPRLRRLDERPLRGELGAVGQGDRHQVVERPAGSIRVIWRWSCSSGTTTARGSSRRTCVRSALATRHSCRAGRRLLLEVGEHVPGPIDLDLGDQVLAQAARSARPGRAPARRCRGRRRTSRGTGGRGSRRRRSGAGRRSWRSGCPSAGSSGPAARPGARR